MKMNDPNLIENNNYIECNHQYVNIPSLETYEINQEMNIIPKESISSFSEKDEMNKENSFPEKVTNSHSKDNESTISKKLNKLYLNKSKNSYYNPSFQLEPIKYIIFNKENKKGGKFNKKLYWEKELEMRKVQIGMINMLMI